RDQAEAFMLQALSGGVWDHVFGGFHRGARENRLILPQFEKPVVHNLAMALVLAALADGGAGPARIVTAARRQRRFLSDLLAGSDEVLAEESDTQRHSWRAREFSAAAGSASSYVGGVHFGI